VKQVWGGGYSQQTKEFKTVLLCSADDDLPDPTRNMGPSGGENHPGQKFGIFGPAGPDLNIHHLFLFAQRLACSMVCVN
jgi:hypothetical protein